MFINVDMECEFINIRRPKILIMPADRRDSVNLDTEISIIESFRRLRFCNEDEGLLNSAIRLVRVVICAV